MAYLKCQYQYKMVCSIKVKYKKMSQYMYIYCPTSPQKSFFKFYLYLIAFILNDIKKKCVHNFYFKKYDVKSNKKY